MHFCVNGPYEHAIIRCKFALMGLKELIHSFLMPAAWSSPSLLAPMTHNRRSSLALHCTLPPSFLTQLLASKYLLLHCSHSTHCMPILLFSSPSILPSATPPTAPPYIPYHKPFQMHENCIQLLLLDPFLSQLPHHKNLLFTSSTTPKPCLLFHYLLLCHSSNSVVKWNNSLPDSQCFWTF